MIFKALVLPFRLELRTFNTMAGPCVQPPPEAVHRGDSNVLENIRIDLESDFTLTFYLFDRRTIPFPCPPRGQREQE